MGARGLAVVASLVAAAGLAVGGCSSGGRAAPAGAAGCTGHRAAGGTGVGPASGPGSAGAGALNPAVAAGWTLPGGNLQNTRDVASAISSADVAALGVAWKLPVGVDTGHDNDGLLAEHATPASASTLLPGKFTLEPGVFGGIETQLATNGSTTFAAVNNLSVRGYRPAPGQGGLILRPGLARALMGAGGTARAGPARRPSRLEGCCVLKAGPGLQV
jgi:hypothetical protein